jgi:hypothetical protein
MPLNVDFSGEVKVHSYDLGDEYQEPKKKPGVLDWFKGFTRRTKHKKVSLSLVINV